MSRCIYFVEYEARRARPKVEDNCLQAILMSIKGTQFGSNDSHALHREKQCRSIESIACLAIRYERSRLISASMCITLVVQESSPVQLEVLVCMQ